MGFPTVSTLISSIELQLTTGEVSVKPYPCNVGKPMAFKNEPTSYLELHHLK